MESNAIRVVIVSCYLSSVAAVLASQVIGHDWPLIFAVVVAVFGGVLHIAEALIGRDEQ